MALRTQLLAGRVGSHMHIAQQPSTTCSPCCTLGRPVVTPRSPLATRSRATPGTDSPTETAASGSSNTSSNSSSQPKDVFDPEFAKGLLEELQDQSQLGQRGEGWTIAQFALAAVVIWPPFHSTELVNLGGGVLLLGGLGAMAWGFQALGNSLTPLPQPRKDSQLVRSGPYEYLRHPMYGGLLMASLGLAAVAHDEARLLAAAVLWLVLEQKVGFEEELLLERYGAAYQDYQKSVKKFIPFLY